MDPIELLKNAISAVPAMKYALAVVGVVAVVAIVSALKIDYKVAVVGALIVVFLMVILLIFANLSTFKSSYFSTPALVFAWFSLIMIMSISTSLFTSVFFQWPVDLKNWLKQEDKQFRSDPPRSFKRIYFENFNSILQDEFESSGLWLIGARDDWEGKVEDGSYVLCNRLDHENSSYTSKLTYLDGNNAVQDLSDAKVTMQVEVKGNAGKYSGVGILYRMSGKNYYAYILQAGKSVSLYQAEEGKVLILWSEDVSRLMQDSNKAKLEISGEAGRIHLYFNGKDIFTHENAAYQNGDPGVFAYSTGCFVIDSMSVYQKITR